MRGTSMHTLPARPPPVIASFPLLGPGPRTHPRPSPAPGPTAALHCRLMADELHTTAVVQNFLDDLKGDTPADPIVRDLLSRAAGRLHLLCASMLSRHYARLPRPPLNLRSEEMLSGLVERLLK